MHAHFSWLHSPEHIGPSTSSVVGTPSIMRADESADSWRRAASLSSLFTERRTLFSCTITEHELKLRDRIREACPQAEVRRFTAAVECSTVVVYSAACRSMLYDRRRMHITPAKRTTSLIAIGRRRCCRRVASRVANRDVKRDKYGFRCSDKLPVKQRRYSGPEPNKLEKIFPPLKVSHLSYFVFTLHDSKIKFHSL